jgi:hypothetical protein
MEGLPFDVLCFLIQRAASIWLAVDLLELRLVSKLFLRACDSAPVVKHWREHNVEVLVWQARTMRFCPSEKFHVGPFADVTCGLARSKKNDLGVSLGALAWLRYATFESVVPALQRGRSRAFV